MDDKTWVDFRAIKARVTIGMVLSHYGVNGLRRIGKELRGKCPIHKGDSSDAFHANEEKNAFHCFSCHAKGNVLDFVAAMESCTVRDSALRLADWFGVETEPAIPNQPNGRREMAKEGSIEPATMPTVINPPLKFQLRVDGTHEYARTRGLDPQTVEHFGAGLCVSKGTFAGRFVVPLHDALGQLVGYAGRSIDGKEPKYLFPSSEKSFHKKYLLFNYHRVIKEIEKDDIVVLVEGFFDCMKVDQAGFPCVALLGSSLSREQEEMIVSEFTRVVLMFDGDEAGRNATADCLKRLSRHIFVRVVDLPDGKQPDLLSEMDLQELLG
jgi:DNA primase